MLLTTKLGDFSTLALQLCKYQYNLLNTGLQFKLEDNNNFFYDTIILSKQDSYKVYNFIIVAHLWERYRQFTLCTNTSGTSGRYHFRLNPVNNEPIRTDTRDSFSLMYPIEIPEELKVFANEILGIIASLEVRYLNDKLAHDSTYLI
jgi:hypothetical protein